MSTLLTDQARQAADNEQRRNELMAVYQALVSRTEQANAKAPPEKRAPLPKWDTWVVEQGYNEDGSPVTAPTPPEEPASTTDNAETEQGGDAGGSSEDERPLTDVQGIGAATAEKLEKAGITTLAELAAADAAEVAKAISQPEERVAAFIASAGRLVNG